MKILLFLFFAYSVFASEFNLNMYHGKGCVAVDNHVYCSNPQKGHRQCSVNQWGEVICNYSPNSAIQPTDNITKNVKEQKKEEPFFRLQ